MNWTRLKQAYGFTKPYDFNRAIPALLDMAFLVAWLISFLSLLIPHKISFGTERMYFFVYVLAGLSVAHWNIRSPKLYWPLFSWFVIEFCLAMFVGELFPFDADFHFTNRFKYHSLLQGTPIPNLDIRIPNLHIIDQGMNLDPDGGDLVIRHNALGLRDSGVEAKNLRSEGLIFAFGGSTTYDIAVTQGKTWVERLNRLLGPEFKVFNFGVPAYGSAEHVIQTAFYGDIDGVYPACAIYYVGWNDIRDVRIANLDRGYADFHLPNQVRALRTRRSLAMTTVSPLLKIAVRAAGLLLDTIQTPSPMRDTSPDADKHTAFKTIYQSHIDTIAAINRARGVKTLIIGQLLNRERLVGDGTNEWQPFVKDGEVWALQSEFNNLLEVHAISGGYDYIDVDINEFDNSDFADQGHFNSKGANKFASLIQGDIKRLCSP